jgi:glycosyltransferase involved in cell wall biosynthesis
MKIVHILNSLEMGGAEMVVLALARGQRASGHDVSVCAWSLAGPVGDALRADGFQLRTPGEKTPWMTVVAYFRIFRQLKPDVVHCHNRGATLHAALSARLAGVQSVITTRHNLVAPYDDDEIKYTIVSGICHRIVGVCEATCKNLREAPFSHARKIVRVYNGAEPLVRTDFSALGKRGFTLVFVGRLAAVKDLGTLLRAVAIAAEKVLGMELWIVGDGPSRPALEAQAADLGIAAQVRFWGQRLDTAPFFSAADAFVMSSVSEGLPISLLQAMSLGVPSIVTDVGGMAELVRRSGGGLLVPVGDAEKFAQAIVRMAYDHQLRDQLAGFALHCFGDDFTLNQMEDAYTEVYRHERISRRRRQVAPVSS